MGGAYLEPEWESYSGIARNNKLDSFVVTSHSPTWFKNVSGFFCQIVNFSLSKIQTASGIIQVMAHGFVLSTSPQLTLRSQSPSHPPSPRFTFSQASRSTIWSISLFWSVSMCMLITCYIVWAQDS